MFRQGLIASGLKKLEIGQSAAKSDEADANAATKQKGPALKQALTLVGVVEEHSPVDHVSRPSSV